MGTNEAQEILAAYLAGTLPLEKAVEHFVALEQSSGPGFGLDLTNLGPAERDRAEQLFGRIFWCKLTGADPSTAPPAPYFEMLDDFQKQFEHDRPIASDEDLAV